MSNHALSDHQLIDMHTLKLVRYWTDLDFAWRLILSLALYGKSYIDGARDAWHLLKDRGKPEKRYRPDHSGWSYSHRYQCSRKRFAREYKWASSEVSNIRQITDFYILIALLWGAYLVGALCSLFAYLYLRCKSSNCAFLYFLANGFDSHASELQRWRTIHCTCCPDCFLAWGSVLYVSFLS